MEFADVWLDAATSDSAAEDGVCAEAVRDPLYADPVNRPDRGGPRRFVVQGLGPRDAHHVWFRPHGRRLGRLARDPLANADPDMCPLLPEERISAQLHPALRLHGARVLHHRDLLRAILREWPRCAARPAAPNAASAAAQPRPPRPPRHRADFDVASDRAQAYRSSYRRS